MLRNHCARRRALSCAIKISAFLFSLPGWAVPVFQVQAIGPAGFNSSATAISGTGAVVGNYQQTDGTYRAFLWQGGNVTTLAMPAGSLQTWATAIGGGRERRGLYRRAASRPR